MTQRPSVPEIISALEIAALEAYRLSLVQTVLAGRLRVINHNAWKCRPVVDHECSLLPFLKELAIQRQR